MKALAISSAQKILELEDGIPTYRSQQSIIKVEEEKDENEAQANSSAHNKQKREFARQMRDLLLGLEHGEHQDLKVLIRKQITNQSNEGTGSAQAQLSDIIVMIKEFKELD